MTMSKELGKLEEAALKRKERLKTLKRKFDGQAESGDVPAATETSAEIPK